MVLLRGYLPYPDESLTMGENIRRNKMQFIIAILIGGLIFAACFAILLLKGRKKDQPVRLHMCGQDETCHCKNRQKADGLYDLKSILEKVRDQDA